MSNSHFGPICTWHLCWGMCLEIRWLQTHMDLLISTLRPSPLHQKRLQWVFLKKEKNPLYFRCNARRTDSRMGWKDGASGLKLESAFNRNATHLKPSSCLYLAVDCNAQEYLRGKKGNSRKNWTQTRSTTRYWSEALRFFFLQNVLVHRETLQHKCTCWASPRKSKGARNEQHFRARPPEQSSRTGVIRLFDAGLWIPRDCDFLLLLYPHNQGHKSTSWANFTSADKTLGPSM